MLVGISGSQGQGKTTVCNNLQQLGFNVVQNKTSRSILNDWGYTLDEVNRYAPLTVKFQDEVLRRHIEFNREAASGDKINFSERTFADIFSYALFVVGPFNKYDTWLNEYYEKCKAAQNMYSKVIYLSGRTYKPQEDGVRSINIHYTSAVDTLIYSYIKDFCRHERGAPERCFTIKTPDHDERIKQILEIIKQP